MPSISRSPAAIALLLAGAGALSGARADDLRGVQRPDGGSLSGRQDGASSQAARAEAIRARAVFEEVATPAAAPPAPEGDERRAIGESVRKRTDEITRCYEEASAQSKKATSKVIARFDIGPNGKVIGASADGVNDPQLVACVVAILRKLSFDKPRSGGNLRVAYPFFFAAAAPK